MRVKKTMILVSRSRLGQQNFVASDLLGQGTNTGVNSKPLPRGMEGMSSG
jgi:hypothetical protein